jgi:hypothetical protein
VRKQQQVVDLCAFQIDRTPELWRNNQEPCGALQSIPDGNRFCRGSGRSNTGIGCSNPRRDRRASHYFGCGFRLWKKFLGKHRPAEQNQAGQQYGDDDITLVVQNQNSLCNQCEAGLWHRIMTVPAPWMAAQYTLSGQPATLKCAVSFKRGNRISRTTRRITASWWNKP